MTVVLQGKLSLAKDKQTTNPEVENDSCSVLPIIHYFFFLAGVNIQDPHPSGLGSSSVSSVCLASMRT